MNVLPALLDLRLRTAIAEADAQLRADEKAAERALAKARAAATVETVQSRQAGIDHLVRNGVSLAAARDRAGGTMRTAAAVESGYITRDGRCF